MVKFRPQRLPQVLIKEPIKTSHLFQGYIYRGNEYEQLQEFRDRLLDEWPDAEVLPKLDPPGPEITESDGQCILF